MTRTEYWRRMSSSEDREAAFAEISKEVAREVITHKQDAVDMLQELAQAHGLVRKLGQDRVQEIMARAFGWQPIITK